MFGEPTGLTVKGWLSDVSSIDGGVGVSFDGEDNLHLHADYHYHIHDLFTLSRDELLVYFGGGLRYKVLDHSEDRFGFRLVGGLDYLLENTPVDFFFEAGPVLDVTPDTDVGFTVAAGVRYWF
jgi:hypothetical protein